MALQPPEDIAKKNTASQTNLIEGSSTQFVPSINVSNKQNESIQLASGAGPAVRTFMGMFNKGGDDFVQVFKDLNKGSVATGDKIPIPQSEGLVPSGYSEIEAKKQLGKRYLSDEGFQTFKEQDYKSISDIIQSDATKALDDIEAEELKNQQIIKDAQSSITGEQRGYGTDTGAMSFNKIEEMEAAMKRDAVSLDEGGDFNFENIESADDVKRAISAVTEVYDKSKYTRGNISHNETIDAAAGEFADEIGLARRLLKRKKGELFNSETMVAIRMLVDNSAKKLVNMARKIEQGQATEFEMLQYRRQMSVHAALVLQAKGAQTEVARALNSFNIKVGGDMDPARAMEMARLNMSGESLDTTQEMARAMLAAYKENGTAGLTKIAENGWYVTTKRAVHELYLSSILSATSSNVRNIFGNFTYMVYQLPTELLAGLYSDAMRGFRPDKLSSLAEDQKYSSDALIRFGAWVNAHKDAWKALKYAWKHEMPASAHKLDTETMAAIKAGSGAYTARGTYIGDGLHWSGRIARAPLTFLLSMDEYFKTIIQNGELAVQAHQKFQHTLRVSGGDVEKAKDAAAMVFLDPKSKASEMTAKALADTLQEELPQWISRPARAAQNNLFGRFILPFTTSPTNGFKHVALNTPIVQFINPTLRADLAGKNGFGKQQAAMGRVSFSYMTSAAIFTGAHKGRITGGWPVDKDEKEQLPPGWLPYSFVFKGEGFPEGMPMYDQYGIPNGPLTYVSYAGIEPVGGIIATLADAWIVGSENIDDWEDIGKNIGHISAGAALATARYYNELPFLQGMSDVVDLVDSLQEYDNVWEGISELDKLTRSGAENFPFIFSSLQRQIGRTIDPSKYDVRGRMPELYTLEEVETKIYRDDGSFYYEHSLPDGRPDYSVVGTPRDLGSTFDLAKNFGAYVRDYATKNTVQSMGLVNREGKSAPRYDSLGNHIDSKMMNFRGNPIGATLTNIIGVRVSKGEEPSPVHIELMRLAENNPKDGWALSNPKDKDGLRLSKGIISDWMALAKSENGIKINWGNGEITFQQALKSLLDPYSLIGMRYNNAISDEEKWKWFKALDQEYKKEAWAALLQTPGYENLARVWADKRIIQERNALLKSRENLEDYRSD